MKCRVVDSWASWASSYKGSVSLRPCRWITGPGEQKICLAGNNVHFSTEFLITKTSSSLPRRAPCTRAPLLLFEQIPAAHTGFPIHIPQGFLKGTQSPSSNYQRRTACPLSQTVCSGDTPRPVLLRRGFPGRKQSNRMAPHQSKNFLQSPKLNSTMTMKGTKCTTPMWPRGVNTITIFSGPTPTCFHEGHRGSAHNFSSVTDAAGVKVAVAYVSLGPLRSIDKVQLLKKAPSASLVHSD